MADSEYCQLKWLLDQGLSIDGMEIPLIIEGGLVDRSVGIDEPPFLTIPDEYDTQEVREALFAAHQKATKEKAE